MELDDIVETLSVTNQQLITWSSKSIPSLTEFGARHFSSCSDLMNLNLKGCVVSDPGNCLREIALGCPKLEKLVISDWTNLNDDKLLPVILSLPNLTHLNISGTEVTTNICEIAFTSLPRLVELNIVCCDILNRQVSI